MLENEMEINKLEEEELELQKQAKELIEQNKQLIEELKACQDIMYNNNNLVAETDETEDKPLTYEQWLETEEAEQLANAYAEAMNDTKRNGEINGN